jgi:ABC-type uncharacterized transport system involved in gliding motility auxiliary subunit
MQVNRQMKYGAFAGSYLVVIVGVIAAINYLANQNNKTFDTTANKRYSLSEQTEKIVKGLGKEVKITYWDEAVNFPKAKDLLQRYADLSPKLKVDYVDANKKPGLAREAGITALGTTTVISGTKREEAKAISEEEISGAIIRVVKDKERVICFSTGSNEAGLEEATREGYSSAKQLMERDNYKTDILNLVEKAEIPERCTVVVVAGPRYELTATAVAALKKRVEDGGRVLFLMDAPLAIGKTPVSPNPGIKAVLAEWGVSLNEDLVLDNSQIGQLMGLSAAAPVVSKFSSHPIVRDFGRASAAMLLTRSLEIKNTDKVTGEALYFSSASSFATANLKSAEIIPDESKDKKGPFALAVAGSYKTGQENKQGRFVVVGNAGFASNGLIGFQANKDLFVNMIAWLASDEDLISIRPKDPEDRRIQMNKGQVLTVRLVSQFLLPLLTIVAGVFVWWKRR